MHAKSCLAILILLLSSFPGAMADESGAPSTSPPELAPRPPRRADLLPPSQETAKAALERSPRHGEFVDVKLADGTPIRTWVVYPERKDKAGVLLIIHEVYGLTDWLRAIADQFAREGFIAVAPDLISGLGPGGGGTDSAGSRDEAVKLVRQLTPEQIRARLDAVRAYAEGLPASSGKLATVGFCWGGARSFEYAAVEPPTRGAVVFYGASPDSATLAKVRAPVLGNYGGDDARINVTIDATLATLKELGRRYQPHIYPGAGHGFLRAQEDREGANRAATRAAWPRTIAFLKAQLK